MLRKGVKSLDGMISFLALRVEQTKSPTAAAKGAETARQEITRRQDYFTNTRPLASSTCWLSQRDIVYSEGR
jgi:hypothetical protein